MKVVTMKTKAAVLNAFLWPQVGQCFAALDLPGTFGKEHKNLFILMITWISLKQIYDMYLYIYTYIYVYRYMYIRIVMVDHHLIISYHILSSFYRHVIIKTTSFFGV